MRSWGQPRRYEPDIKDLVASVLFTAELQIYRDFDLDVQITKQSPDIALGVDKKGAGDRGMMFGYATNETAKMLPLPFVLATEAISRLKDRDRKPDLPGLHADGRHLLAQAGTPADYR